MITLSVASLCRSFPESCETGLDPDDLAQLDFCREIYFDHKRRRADEPFEFPPTYEDPWGGIE